MLTGRMLEVDVMGAVDVCKKISGAVTARIFPVIMIVVMIVKKIFIMLFTFFFCLLLFLFVVI